jgi:hypothetical protein
MGVLDRSDNADKTLPTAYEKPRRSSSAPDGGVAELRAGAVLGKYRIVRHLGTGGMGSVYEALHVEIDKPVALKILSGSLAGDPRSQARFQREATTLSRLDHPNVVSVTDFGWEAATPFLVMELLRGEDLGEHLIRHLHGLAVADAVDILLPVVAGVVAAHEAGVIHRDLKPRNIFLARSKVKQVEPKVLDFGIAKRDGDFRDASLTDSGAIMGTVAYLSPEQVAGKTADARSDQFALGVILFECLTGRPPHEGHSHLAIMKAISDGRFFRPSSLRKDLPAGLEQIVLRSMNQDPARRFDSVFEFGRALLPFASDRERAFWAAYFGREGAQQPAPSQTVPFAVAASPALAPTHERAMADSEVIALPDYPATDRTRLASRGGGRIALVLGAIGAVAVVAFLGLQRVPSGPTETPPIATERPAEKEPVRQGKAPSPFLPATQSAIPSTTAAPVATDEVTVRLVGLPSGSTVSVDGAPSSMPVRVRRGSGIHELMIQAPGYEEITRTVDAREDVDLPVNLRPLPIPKPRASAKAAAASTSAGSWGFRRPGAKVPREAAEPKPPPAITDF